MFPKCILYTLPGGTVSLCYPADECIAELTRGGRPMLRGRRHWEIEKFVRGGVSEGIAARWIDSVISGGKTTAEAFELIRLKDVPREAMAVEVVEIQEVPTDRWFRDAWRRSSNGGPIYIDIDKAIEIQARKIAAARNDIIERCNSNEPIDIMLGNGRLIGFRDRVVGIDLADLGCRLRSARSLEEVRALWPEELSIL
jgi:hypothetical protein